jgi:hypothetical protein
MRNSQRELHNDSVVTLTAAQVARLLGGEVYDRDGVRAPGPGHSPKDRSLRIWIDPTDENGFRVHSFVEDWRVCRDYVCERLGLPTWQPHSRTPSKPRPRFVSNCAGDDGQKQREKARWLWDQSRPSQGTVVERYLASRGIELPALPATLRFLPARPPEHPYAAMIAPFALVYEPEPGRLRVPKHSIAGVHITRLRADGSGKAGTEKDKIMLGPSTGVPIVVAPANDNLGLAVTEGIEDALSVHFATGLGAWAAGSATRMPALADAIPEHIECVTVVADANEVGQRNADELARRLIKRGTDVDITTPVVDLEAAA